MYFKHFFEKGLAQNSYLVGCQATGEAIVIDPRRDIDDYLAAAADNDLRITHIAETHIHADFLSGTPELAAATGARVLLSEEGGADWTYQFDHEPLRDGDVVRVGNLKLEVIHTPGHTPEHISLLLTNPPAGPDPVMVFTGDFVFVGDVGRPDLLEEAAGIENTKVDGARQMFGSLRRFREIPEFVQVWPAHGAGSACGKALGAVPSSTVGYEIRTNWALAIEDEEVFVEILLEGQPEPPYYFATMKHLNKVGAPLLAGRPSLTQMDSPTLRAAVSDDAQLVDTRSTYAFAGGHIPGSLNIPNESDAATWAGWLLDYERPVVLVADRRSALEFRTRLNRIGLDRVVGYVPDVDAYRADGGRLESIEQVHPAQLESGSDDGLLVIDVRGRSEYQESHIPGALNIHVGHLAKRSDEVPADRPVVVHCQTGYRSVIAISLLQTKHRTNVRNLMGGFAAWEDRAEEQGAEEGAARRSSLASPVGA